MTTLTNHQIRLAARPVGLPTRADWRVTDKAVAELADGDAKLADLHVWQVGPGAYAAALVVVADDPQPCARYEQRLHAVKALKHTTIAVHRCQASTDSPG